MIVTNRKLFKKRPARDRLNQAAGIMASSPELMGEVQGFQNGGNVQLPGTVGSIVQMLDAVTELPEIVVKGIKSKFSPKTPVNPIQEVPVTMPNGEPGFAIYENGKLKGYTTSPSSQPMIKDRSKQIKEITSEVRPPVNVSSTSLSNLLRGLVGADKGKSEAVQEFEEAKKRGELGIQDSRLLDFLGGRGTYAETGLTGILRLVPELKEFVGDLSGSALDLLRQPTDETKRKSVSQTLPGVNYRSQGFPEGIPKDTPVSVEATPEQIFDLISQGTGPKGDPETVEQILKQMEIDRITAKSIQKGKEDTERMKGPVAPTTSLSSRVEKVKAEARKKEAEDLSRAIGSKIRPDGIWTYPKGDPETRGEVVKADSKDVETRKQYQEEKEIEELNRIVSENQKQAEKAMGRGSTSTNVEDQKDNETFDVMGDLDNNQKEAIVKQTNNIVETTTGSNLDQLMKEFTSKAPEYEGINKGMAIAKIGFAIAAGKSADGIQNIADGLSMGADMLMKDDADKAAFNRQVQLSALQYGLGEISKEKAQARQDARSFEKFVDKDGNPVLIPLSEIMESGGRIPKGLQDPDLYLESVKAADERLKSYYEAAKKRIDDLVLDPKQQREALEPYENASIDFQQSTNAAKLAESLLLQVADESNNITSLGTAFKDVANKAFNAAGIDPGKTYETLAEFQADLKIAFQALIPLKLGATQSANSISDRDVNLLARAYFGTAVLGGGSFSLVGMDTDVLSKKLKNVLKEFEDSANSALTKMRSEEEFLFRSGYLQADRKTLVADRLETFKPEGIDDITAYNPNMTYDKNKNRYIINIGGK